MQIIQEWKCVEEKLKWNGLEMFFTTIFQPVSTSLYTSTKQQIAIVWNTPAEYNVNELEIGYTKIQLSIWRERKNDSGNLSNHKKDTGMKKVGSYEPTFSFTLDTLYAQGAKNVSSVLRKLIPPSEK